MRVRDKETDRGVGDRNKRMKRKRERALIELGPDEAGGGAQR